MPQAACNVIELQTVRDVYLQEIMRSALASVVQGGPMVLDTSRAVGAPSSALSLPEVRPPS